MPSLFSTVLLNYTLQQFTVTKRGSQVMLTIRAGASGHIHMSIVTKRHDQDSRDARSYLQRDRALCLPLLLHWILNYYNVARI